MSLPLPPEDKALTIFKVCPVCGTEATRVNGRLRGSRYWWCWRCEQAIRPVESQARR